MKIKRSLRMWVFSACCVSGLAITAVSRSWAEIAEEDNRLTIAEEDYAYNAKNPCQRVKAFLKIADIKVESVRKALRKDTSSDVSLLLRGYSTALEGAWMGVSWGRAKGTDMTESIHAIEKATQRHLTTLQKLEAHSRLSQQETLAQIQSAVTKSQKSEQELLAAVKK